MFWALFSMQMCLKWAKWLLHLHSSFFFYFQEHLTFTWCSQSVYHLFIQLFIAGWQTNKQKSCLFVFYCSNKKKTLVFPSSVWKENESCSFLFIYFLISYPRQSHGECIEGATSAGIPISMSRTAVAAWKFSWFLVWFVSFNNWVKRLYMDWLPPLVSVFLI